MEKEKIIFYLREVIIEDINLYRSIFGDADMPEMIDDVVLSISSIDFVDLLIKMEEKISLEFAEDCITSTQISIGELAERIKELV